MVKLVNSAMMPSPDFAYVPRRISQEEFVRILKTAAKDADFESYIGYPATAEHIERISGVKVNVNRAETTVQPGDILLVCKLRYRLNDPTQKNNPQFQSTGIQEEDFDYWVIEVHEQETYLNLRTRGIMR